MRSKLMIIGYGRHGKDTVAEYLRDKYGFTFQSSSYAAASAILPMLQAVRDYGSVEEAFEDRHACISLQDDGDQIFMRQVWYEAIRLLNKGDPTTLAKQIYSKSDIYVGIRSIDEFKAIKAKRMFDLAIWVDASHRLPPEDISSNTITIDQADVVLDNNKNLGHLFDQIDNLVQKSIIRVE